MGAGTLAQIYCGQSQLDTYINCNPEISYFKYAYRRHTNFGLDNVTLSFDNSPYLTNRDINFICYIIKNDYNFLLDLYLKYTIPDIYSSDKYKFRWVSNFGTLFIKELVLKVNGNIIDTTTGEWITISNELTQLVKDNFNKMTGNISSFFDPKMDIPVITINNNRYKNAYPIGDKNANKPSIKGKEIVVPLNLNISKNPSLGLILTRITGGGNNIWIELILENIENLYQVYSSDLDLYISPAYYNELFPNDKISIDTFVKSKELNASIEATYAIVGNEDLTWIGNNANLDILTEKIIKSTDYSITPGTDLVNITTLTRTGTHIKELIWTLKRDDYYKFNTTTNYTNSIPENQEKSIMSKAKITLNNFNRIEEKNANFFNVIQPYKHHSAVPKQGIYSYSFALFPELHKPSGSLNGSSFEISLYTYTNEQDNSVINEKLKKLNIAPYNYKYKMNYYIRSMNVLRYLNGTLSYVYAE
jgi:hypothetical protein